MNLSQILIAMTSAAVPLLAAPQPRLLLKTPTHEVYVDGSRSSPEPTLRNAIDTFYSLRVVTLATGTHRNIQAKTVGDGAPDDIIQSAIRNGHLIIASQGSAGVYDIGSGKELLSMPAALRPSISPTGRWLVYEHWPPRYGRQSAVLVALNTEDLLYRIVFPKIHAGVAGYQTVEEQADGVRASREAGTLRMSAPIWLLGDALLLGTAETTTDRKGAPEKYGIVDICLERNITLRHLELKEASFAPPSGLRNDGLTPVDAINAEPVGADKVKLELRCVNCPTSRTITIRFQTSCLPTGER